MLRNGKKKNQQISPSNDSHSTNGTRRRVQELSFRTLLWGIKFTVLWVLNFLTMNQSEETHLNQGNPQGEFYGTLLWGMIAAVFLSNGTADLYQV